MAYYANGAAVRQIDADLFAAWVAAGNPKANGWTLIQDPPSPAHTWDGAQWVGPQVAPMVASLVLRIDADVDAVYATVIGQRAVEYMEAEEDAQAFKQGGYTGTVPPSVASWVAASGLTAQAAADDILATAAQWRTAAQSMRAARLGYKAQARAASTVQAVNAVAAAWRGTINAIRAALGLPGV